MTTAYRWVGWGCMVILSGACILNRGGIDTGGSAGNAQGGSAQGGGGVGGGGGHPLCGNAILDMAEECDDGNTDTSDGCGDDCQVEDGWSCDGAEPTICSEICGDFLLVGSEECDDGNTTSSDGCDENCRFEASCGNSLIEPGEQCDDGNTTSGDGCDGSCVYEAGSACGDAVDLQGAATTVVEDTYIYDGTTSGSPYVDGVALQAPPPMCVGPRTSGVPMRVHRYVLNQPGRLLARLDHVRGGITDSVLWMFTDCEADLIMCNDDIGGPRGNRRSHVASPVQLAGTAIYIAVAAYDASDSGPYRLRVTEMPLNPLLTEPPGSCDAPQDGLPGAALDGILSAADPNTLTASCEPQPGPESVFRLALPTAVDAFSTAVSFSTDYEPHLFSMAPSCSAANERVCAPSADRVTRTRDLDVDDGDYFMAVDGETNGGGRFVMVTDTVEILQLGATCTSGDPATRCATGLACAPNNTCVQALLYENFDNGLGSLNSIGTGEQWTLCDGGCSGNERTGSYSLKPYLVLDDELVVDTIRSLRTGQLNINGLNNVWVEFDHSFITGGCPQQEGRLEISTDGATFTPVDTFDSFISNQHEMIEISNEVGNESQLWVQWTFDQGQVTNCNGTPWRLDDLRVYAY